MTKAEKTSQQRTPKRRRPIAKTQRWVLTRTTEAVNEQSVFQGSPPSMPTPYKLVGKASPRQADRTSTSSHE